MTKIQSEPHQTEHKADIREKEEGQTVRAAVATPGDTEKPTPTADKKAAAEEEEE
eukprot:CAMPEP_0202473080 /NCGR_PEP_ID=MMETSP1360-20130828/89829_1 /ASSEMBLY_ACC=CAM_ASM_000848 /TAXON_ID=515479 /ORGANISM="Licmophora paradoxa, Strain CCMP2313" /LENGTH=54 /DNA_ID=CAMNT_0049099833 /DNA_START=30 /DNA_END=191 /DNA_ORIENTATION=+